MKLPGHTQPADVTRPAALWRWEELVLVNLVLVNLPTASSGRLKKSPGIPLGFSLL